MVTKYAEWITQSCGCRWLMDIGTIADKDDTNCTKDHTPRKCLECGEFADPVRTISHGTLFGTPIHSVRFV